MIKHLKYLIFLVLLFPLAISIGYFSGRDFFNGDAVSLDLVSPVTDAVEQMSVLPSKVLPLKRELKFMVGGDVMFDRYIRQVALDEGYGYILEGIGDVLREVSFSLVNLEGPITEFPSVSMYSEFGSRDNYIFTFDPVITKTLSEFKMLVSLGNNHVLNFGQDGLTQTLGYLEKDEISYFGQVGREDVPHYLIIEENGFKIGLINYNQFINDDRIEVLETIETLKDTVEFTVVYAHWGNEYVMEAGKVVQDLAHEFVLVGADLVVGSHPHVVQQIEEYEGSMIYYSLGNMVFDQYFEEETMEGLLVRVDLEREEERELKVVYTEIPIQLLPSGQSTLQETTLKSDI